MCAIFGKIYLSRQKINPENEYLIIKRAIQTLKHRGPDGEGYKIFQSGWLASTRLAINDFSDNAVQPYISEDGRYILVFNGEIYNFRDLRRTLNSRHRFRSNSDAEVVLHLFEDKGIGCLNDLNGMFAFAVWDNKEKRLFLVRDRFGVKPLKYFVNCQFIAFSSELKALFDIGNIRKELDFNSIGKYLVWGFVPSPDAGFLGIKKLSAGSFLVADASGKHRIERYFSPHQKKNEDYSENEWVEKMDYEITRSIKLRIPEEVKWGIHLSGGLDSSLVAAVSSRIYKKRIKTFSIIYEKEDSQDERENIRKTVHNIGSDHREIVFDEKESLDNLPEMAKYYEEPFADPSMLPTWQLMKESSKEVKVALNGDGADEAFGGYTRYRIYSLFKYLKLLTQIDRFNKVLTGNIDRIVTPLKSDNNICGFYRGITSINRESIVFSLLKGRRKELMDNLNFSENSLASKNILESIRYLDYSYYLPDFYLAKTDISSMRFGIEARSSFLDYKLVEKALSIPDKMTVNLFKNKVILRKIIGKYPEIRHILRHKKVPFVPPLGKILTNNKEYIVNTCETSKIIREMFNGDKVKNLLSSYFAGRVKNSYLIFTLLMLDKWCREYFE